MLKMIYLPRFLYLFWHAPIYIPQKLFTEINKLLSSFLWGARVSLDTFFLPIWAGGLALLNLQCYYLASQLTHVHWWGFPKLDIALVATQVAQVHSYEALINVLYRNGPYSDQGASILKLSYKIFNMCNDRVGGTSLTTSPNTPLWHNPQLTEIFKIPDGAWWVNYGVKYAHQLFRDGTFRSFTDIKTEYEIPNGFFFPYL